MYHLVINVNTVKSIFECFKSKNGMTLGCCDVTQSSIEQLFLFPLSCSARDRLRQAVHAVHVPGGAVQVPPRQAGGEGLHRQPEGVADQDGAHLHRQRQPPGQGEID